MPPRSIDPGVALPAEATLARGATIRVAVVSPFEPLATGLAASLQDDGFSVAGAATAIDQLEATLADGFADVLVCDLDALIGCGGLPSLPARGVVLLAGARERSWSLVETVSSLASLHGLAIVEKTGGSAKLRDTVRLVHEGAFVCEMGLMSSAVRRLAALAQGPGPAPMELLTPREVEVLDLVATGLSNKEIGWQLAVSEGTVKAHVSHIMAKLRLANRSQVVAYALASAVPVLEGPRGKGIDAQAIGGTRAISENS